MNPLIWGSTRVKLKAAASRMVVVRGWGRGKGKFLFIGHKVSLTQDECFRDLLYNIVPVGNNIELCFKICA